LNHDNIEELNAHRLKQPIHLAIAIGKRVEMDADFVEQCQVEVGQGLGFVILDVTSPFHSARRATGDQDWQVRVIMDVGIEGGRHPSNAARRLIWWFWCSVCAPQHLDSPFALLLWGGVQESDGMATAKRIAAAQETGEYPAWNDPGYKSKRRLTLKRGRRRLDT
jgi:hypothetical protein